MSDPKHDKSTKLLWVDLEMTGLNPETDRILELAAIVTDFNFIELDQFASVIYQPETVLRNMNEWSRTQHTASGLLDRLKVAPNEQQVVNHFSSFIKNNFLGEPAILAGNSIHQDRRFIRHWWSVVEQQLHYRMLDVSSYKILMQNKFGVDFNKQEAHRALGDIQESIAELKFYLEKFSAF